MRRVFCELDEILFRRRDLPRRYSLASGTDLAINRARGVRFKILKPSRAKFKAKRAVLACKIRPRAKYLLIAGKFCGASCGICELWGAYGLDAEFLAQLGVKFLNADLALRAQRVQLTVKLPTKSHLSRATKSLFCRA